VERNLLYEDIMVAFAGVDTADSAMCVGCGTGSHSRILHNAPSRLSVSLHFAP
jgi:hypothetical protein